VKRTKITILAITAALMAGPSGAQDWSGNWYGVTVGYGSGTYDLGVSRLNEAGPPVDVDGASIGLRYVRNVQKNNTVLGLDAELSTGPDGASPINSLGPDWGCFTGECNVSIKRLATLRGRYGMLVDPGTLAYGAVGVAIGRVEGGILNSEQQGASTAVGYTIGVGLERMLKENVSLLSEANFTDLGTLGFGSNGASETFDGKGDFTTIKLGVNFRF